MQLKSRNAEFFQFADDLLQEQYEFDLPSPHLRCISSPLFAQQPNYSGSRDPESERNSTARPFRAGACAAAGSVSDTDANTIARNPCNVSGGNCGGHSV